MREEAPVAVIGREGVAEPSEGTVHSNGSGNGVRLGQRAHFGSGSAVQRIIELAAVALIAILAARLFWLLFAPLPLPQGEPLNTRAQPSAAAAIAVANPFKTAAVAETAAETASPDVVETTLNLTLTGVWVDEAAASASIQMPDGEQRRFTVGDEIIDGVTLAAVYPDQAIIRRAGVREALKFESKEVFDRPAASARSSGSAQAQLRSGGELPANIGANGPAGFASIMRIAPATSETGERTLELYAAGNRSAFAAFGLRDGDKLVSIDGMAPPSNPAALSSVLSSLQRKSSASLIVERDGKEIPINISLSGLNLE